MLRKKQALFTTLFLLGSLSVANAHGDDPILPPQNPSSQNNTQSTIGPSTKIKLYADRGGDFTLTSAKGRQVALQDYRGQLVLLYFGYTSCPDVCSVALAQLKQLLVNFEGEKIQILFVSIDPNRDTPDQVQQYVQQFDERFVGLSGTPEEITAVARQYAVRYQPETVPGSTAQTVAHTDLIVLIDQLGRFRARYLPKGEFALLLSDIKLLLQKN